MDKVKTLLILAFGVGAYYLLKLFIPFGDLILYPFRLLVTILHEFGHASAALLTGGNVTEIQISMDGSGHCASTGGWRVPIIAGGYIGSALFGNLLIYAGLRHAQWSNYVLYGLMAIMLVISTVWSASIANTIFVGAFAVGIFIISKLRSELASLFLTFMGTLSVIHIIEDFNGGPSSDLAAFTNAVPLLPQTAWMFIWLGIVSWITWLNVRALLR